MAQMSLEMACPTLEMAQRSLEVAFTSLEMANEFGNWKCTNDLEITQMSSEIANMIVKIAQMSWKWPT
jgi:hypothetical protein